MQPQSVVSYTLDEPWYVANEFNSIQNCYGWNIMSFRIESIKIIDAESGTCLTVDILGGK